MKSIFPQVIRRDCYSVLAVLYFIQSKTNQNLVRIIHVLSERKEAYRVPTTWQPPKNPSISPLEFLKNLRVFYQFQLLKDCCRYFISQTFTKTQQIPFGFFAVSLKYFYGILSHWSISIASFSLHYSICFLLTGIFS